jgi:hypothetical protein
MRTIDLTIYRHTYNTRKDRNIIGDLFLNDNDKYKNEFFCYTLEDEKRADGLKVYGETAIPNGIYNVKLTMSNRFKRLMPLLLDVKGFSGVRIHGGNTSKDTHGCPLVAFNTDYNKIWGTAEKKLTSILKNYEFITLTIEDRPLTYDRENKKLL